MHHYDWIPTVVCRQIRNRCFLVNTRTRSEIIEIAPLLAELFKKSDRSELDAAVNEWTDEHAQELGSTATTLESILEDLADEHFVNRHPH